MAIFALALAAIPAVLFVWNLCLVRGLPAVKPGGAACPKVSVLIPARNEAANIGAALDSVLANRAVDLEVLVLDDGSSDGTAGIVEAHAVTDARLKLRAAPALPPGWCGKQHACYVLAGMARGDWLVFMDADVRLAPEALSRMVEFMRQSGAALASGVPRQITGTVLERLLIPLVHFVLLGFLPVWRMRRCTKPAYAAGCGQLFIAEANAYHRIGGHAQIRATLHDGLKLPRLFRRNGFRTDLFDATRVAACRMYMGAGEVVAGLMKNAHEALASRGMILPMTLVLLGGQVLPWMLLALWPVASPTTRVVSAVGVGLTLLPRLLAAWRFCQSWTGALMHPVSIGIFVGLQWAAFVRCLLGKTTDWRGRSYASHLESNARDGLQKAVMARQGVAG